MPRGFGYWRGRYDRPYHRSFAYGRQPGNLPQDDLTATYIGPCRCGYGPHAYYRRADGATVHASDIARTAPLAHAPRDAEMERLNQRIKELEARLDEKG
jgi:hypothetical protein